MSTSFEELREKSESIQAMGGGTPGKLVNRKCHRLGTITYGMCRNMRGKGWLT